MKIQDLDPRDYENMKRYLKDHSDLLKDILDKGRIIREATNREYKSYVKSYGRTIKFKGVDCVVINRGSADNKAFELAAKDIKHDLRISYIKGIDGLYTVSLRTDKGNKNIDCSNVAGSYGGGGHEDAAGFKCEDIIFRNDGIIIK
jgi:oligoribonuclease NrnB/cAMP/cGMP phosphodiesterase (DHH superfamily)